jgi:hypothetical protein
LIDRAEIIIAMVAYTFFKTLAENTINIFFGIFIFQEID